jgi:REP element-mobilizing transposase RayT
VPKKRVEKLPTLEPKSSTQDILRPGGGAETQTDSRTGRGRQKAFAPSQTRGASSPRGEVTGSVLLEPLSRRDYDLSYACLLIPRFSGHLLTGKVTDFLHATIRQTCVVASWRLDFVQVRPEYLQWVVSAPATSPPSRCIHTIRDQTSKGILDKFRQFRDNNPCQDFWAPGYLVLVGPAPHPPEVISEFIRLTRQQQALRAPGGA